MPEGYTNGNHTLSMKNSRKNGGSPTFGMGETSYTYEEVEEISNYLLKRTKLRPQIGIICGSGLGHLAELLKDADSFLYEEIPNFPVSTVAGHAGRMVFGYLNGIEVMCMQGRFHFYEGYPLHVCAMPVRVMKLCGIKKLIATNAAGGLNSDFNVGDIMLIKDHVNIMGFAGNGPLQGPNDHRFGPRFPSMNKAYDPDLLEMAQKLVEETGMEDVVRTGIYTCLGGPNYETVAELKACKVMGIDAVGMSTVHEVIAARHCGLKCFAFSLITNKCITEYDTHEEANHEEVMSTGSLRQSVLMSFVSHMVERIHNTMDI